MVQKLSFFALEKQKFPVKMTGMKGRSYGPAYDDSVLSLWHIAMRLTLNCFYFLIFAYLQG